MRTQPSTTLFPYTTLFRSSINAAGRAQFVRLIERVQRREQQRIAGPKRSEEHTSELQSHRDLVCRLLLEKKKNCWCSARRSRYCGGRTRSPGWTGPTGL